MRRAITASAISATIALLAGIALTGHASADVGEVSVVATFDAEAFELPEGITINKRGDLYVTMPFLPEGNVRRVHPDGTDQVVATLPTGGGFGPLGLTVDAPGNLYVAVTTSDPATQGVYRVALNGAVARLAGSGGMSFPNDVAFGDGGALYVADSAGSLWKIPKGGSAELWLAHELLQGTGELLPFFVGANGIAYRHRTVFVTNTEKGSLLAVPVLPDGSAGTPTVVAAGPALLGADGLELDVHGNFYVNVIAQSTLLRVSADGSRIDTLADGNDRLDFASTSAFGQGADRSTLYTVNFSVGPFFGGTRTFGPAVLAVDAGAPGLPQP